MKIGSSQTVLSAAVLAALTALPVAPVALGQDGVLEEVVVTSRKRTENLQDVDRQVGRQVGRLAEVAIQAARP